MSTEQPLPGHLTRDELNDLISPVSHFRAFLRDAMGPHYGWKHDLFDEGSATYHLFNFSRGSPSLIAGDHDTRVALVELTDPPRELQLYRGMQTGLPHCRIERASLLGRIRGLFGRIRLAGPKAFETNYIVFGREKRAIDTLLKPSLREFLAEAAPDFDMELEGTWAVLYRRGDGLADGGHQAFLDEVKPFIEMLVS